MIRFERPNPARLVLAVAYALATAGLVVIAFDSVIYDRWGIVALSSVALAALAIILLTGYGIVWLAVGGVWIYAAITAMIRAHSNYERVGFGMIFLALAIGALAAYLAYDRAIL